MPHDCAYQVMYEIHKIANWADFFFHFRTQVNNGEPSRNDIVLYGRTYTHFYNLISR